MRSAKVKTREFVSSSFFSQLLEIMMMSRHISPHTCGHNLSNITLLQLGEKPKKSFTKSINTMCVYVYEWNWLVDLFYSMCVTVCVSVCVRTTEVLKPRLTL